MSRSQLLAAFRKRCVELLSCPETERTLARLRREILEKGVGQTSARLHENGQWVAYVLALGSSAYIPAHDHPGTRALLWLVEGKIQIRHYDLLEHSPKGRTALLAIRDRKEMSTGDHDWIGLRRHNLHAIQGIGNVNLLLSIRQHRPDRERRFIYGFLREPGPGDRIGVAIARALKSHDE